MGVAIDRDPGHPDATFGIYVKELALEPSGVGRYARRLLKYGGPRSVKATFVGNIKRAYESELRKISRAFGKAEENRKKREELASIADNKLAAAAARRVARQHLNRLEDQWYAVKLSASERDELVKNAVEAHDADVGALDEVYRLYTIPGQGWKPAAEGALWQSLGNGNFKKKTFAGGHGGER